MEGRREENVWAGEEGKGALRARTGDPSEVPEGPGQSLPHDWNVSCRPQTRARYRETDSTALWTF